MSTAPGRAIGHAVFSVFVSIRDVWRRLRAWRRVSFTSGGLAFTLGTTAVGFAAMNTGNNLLYLLLGAMLGFIIVSSWLSEQAIRDLRIERRGPHAVTVGHDFRLVYEVTNRKKRMPSFAVELTESGLPHCAFLAHVPAAGHASAQSVNSFVRRGVYPLGTVTVSTGFPFGLFLKERDIELPGEVIVWPRTDRVVREPAAGAGRVPRTGASARGAAGTRGEYRSLRTYRVGDDSLQWLLEEAGAGEIFAAGHSERGNDLPLLLSTAKAERVDGGWKFTGHKSFGTMTPVWTRMGFHAMDTSNPDAPQIVHAFLPRDTENVRIEEAWDSLGMRATRSDDTILDGAFVPDSYIARVIPAGAAGMDLFVVGVFAWAFIGFANVYFGIAERMLELTIDYVKNKKSIGLASETYAHHPETQHNIAEMIMLIDSMEPQIDSVSDGYAASVANAGSWGPMDGPTWISKIVSLKQTVSKNALKVADLAIETVGGLGVARHGEFERLYRDARMGPIHPANPALTRELMAKIALGIDLDGQPRWG